MVLRAKPETGVPSDDFVGLLLELVHLRPHMRAMLPSDLLQQKRNLEAMHEAGQGHRSQDIALYYNVGFVLHEEGPLTMTELSETLGVPQSTATRLIDALVNAGFAQRLADPQDRRVVKVALSPAGEDLYQAMVQYARAQAEQVLAQLTPEEQVTLVSLLSKVIAGLRKLPG